MANTKRTLVLGASPKPERYAYKATQMLNEYGHPVIPFGLRGGDIDGVSIVTQLPDTTEEMDTVTLYLGPDNQSPYYDYILGLNPKRVIFNPGTENPEFEQKLNDKGITPLEACTLVLLRTGNY